MHADLRMTFEGVARVCQHQLELLVLEIIVTFDHHTTRISINKIYYQQSMQLQLIASHSGLTLRRNSLGKQTKFNYTTMSNFL